MKKPLILHRLIANDTIANCIHLLEDNNIDLFRLKCANSVMENHISDISNYILDSAKTQSLFYTNDTRINLDWIFDSIKECWIDI